MQVSLQFDEKNLTILISLNVIFSLKKRASHPSIWRIIYDRKNVKLLNSQISKFPSKTCWDTLYMTGFLDILVPLLIFRRRWNFSWTKPMKNHLKRYQNCTNNSFQYWHHFCFDFKEKNSVTRSIWRKNNNLAIFDNFWPISGF